MYIKKINLSAFRNFKSEEIELNKGINIFYGDNAQGKTNLIESVFFSAMGKSFKSVKEKDLILFGEKKAEVSVFYEKNGRTNENKVILSDKKSLFINKVPIKKRMDFIGNLSVVLFTPQEMSIVKEGPYLRRKFLDMCISQMRIKYMHALSSYGKILEQKNKILKEKNYDTLDIWNEKLAEYGSIILWYRLSFINRIKPVIKEIYSQIAGENEILKAAYISSFPAECEKQEAIKRKFLLALSENKEKEIEEETCIIGPHRDDIIFYINGKNARMFGSQGQQRSIVLTLKLMQTRVYFEETGEYPVLLLDDIASELDVKRRNFLFDKIKNEQVIITCTDAEKLKFFENSYYYRVSEGKIIY